VSDTPPKQWRAEFAMALQEHLAGGEEAALLSAYELGRKALADGLGVLEVASLLYEALLGSCADARTPEESARMMKTAEDFMLECLSPFEMAHRGVREANTALRGLNELLEEQTRRISHQLHDGAGQLLVSVYLALDELGHAAPAERPRVQEIRELLDKVEDQLRRLSHELRPTMLDDLGLGPALEFLASRVSARSGLVVAIEGVPPQRLAPRVEVVLYRVVQEALTNASKHSRAAHVFVRVERETRRISCSIRDDGVGFDVAAVMARAGSQGIGLIGIRERLAPLGGTLQVVSAPGRGSELLVTIPGDSSRASNEARPP
jgi:two-component system, NarL family, sensor histidine kinase UhpB